MYACVNGHTALVFYKTNELGHPKCIQCEERAYKIEGELLLLLQEARKKETLEIIKKLCALQYDVLKEMDAVCADLRSAPTPSSDALRVLAEIQWSANHANTGYPICPSCQEYEDDGHAENCRLAAALRAPAGNVCNWKHSDVCNYITDCGLAIDSPSWKEAAHFCRPFTHCPGCGRPISSPPQEGKACTCGVGYEWCDDMCPVHGKAKPSEAQKGKVVVCDQPRRLIRRREKKEKNWRNPHYG